VAPLSLIHLSEPLSPPLADDIQHLDRPYCVIVAGASSAHQGQKRWPIDAFASLCTFLYHNGFMPVIVGTHADSLDGLIHQLGNNTYINAINHTSLYQLITLGGNAVCAIGNDTGPMLALAASGAPTLTFFSRVNPKTLGGAWPYDPHKHHCLESDSLRDLTSQQVWQLTKNVFGLINN
jgi:ADP-heptose:LPS heptosyltransferase